jgi:alpha-galactosidase
VTAWTLQAGKSLVVKHAGPPLELKHWRGKIAYCVRGQGHRECCERLRFEPPSASQNEASFSTPGEHLAIEVRVRCESVLQIEATIENRSAQAVSLEQLAITFEAQLGTPGGRLAFFKNGYQSWTETRSFAAHQQQMVSILSPMNALQDNLRNLASQKKGEFNSDTFAVVGNLDQGIFLLAGQAGGFGQFVYIRASLPAPGGAWSELTLVHDFGGQELAAGARIAPDTLVLLAGDHANEIQDRYFDAIAVGAAAAPELPTGWCSWYYYYAGVKEQDVRENLAAARARQLNWRFFVLDDGYQTAVGDWLSINGKFPAGLEPIAGEIRSAGMAPGLWLAPFIARRNSRLYREHPEWLLRDERGKAVQAGWNPNWGLDGVFYGLDTTQPAFQAHLRELTDTIVHHWGFTFLKLDFTYGAALPGVAYDRRLSPAERLKLGYHIIRQAAGDEAFILGCGSPLGPALGLVDAMRIGPDVAPYWFAKYRYHLTRDPHALCAKFAIRSILNRCQMHRKLWINDPDCLLLRAAETKLSRDERFSLVNAAIITGGMVVISDKLASLDAETWAWTGEIERLVRVCDRGRAWALDYMEREMPELVYNSSGYLAVFNFEDRPLQKTLPLSPHLEGIVAEGARLEDVWNGQSFTAAGGRLELGQMPPHASRLLRLVS